MNPDILFIRSDFFLMEVVRFEPFILNDIGQNLRTLAQYVSNCPMVVPINRDYY